MNAYTRAKHSIILVNLLKHLKNKKILIFADAKKIFCIITFTLNYWNFNILITFVACLIYITIALKILWSLCLIYAFQENSCLQESWSVKYTQTKKSK